MALVYEQVYQKTTTKTKEETMFLEKNLVKTQNPLMDWYKTKIEGSPHKTYKDLCAGGKFVKQFQHEYYERTIWNPGSGKSTILNSLAGECYHHHVSFYLQLVQ